jgi:hypothetical protein
MLRQQQVLMTSPRQRSKLARKAAKARWRKPRLEEITDRARAREGGKFRACWPPCSLRFRMPNGS